ncbi:MAG: ferric reductase-like transmembrane domain-containing protein [Roseococcus sp.]|nr:ferric reductase-like transmembrane domain-containing protein [Roseococcus sp.]
MALTAPWRDRAGRVCGLRLAALALLSAPGLLLLQGWAAGTLGPDPVERATHETGRWAIRFLVLTLAVTPLGRVLGWPRLFALRRMLGLGALAWAGLHLGLFVAEQNGVLWRVAAEIAQRAYLAIGFAALCGLAVLGWTSTDGWMRRLGRRWKRLHRLVFLLAPLALLHAFIQSKSDASQAVLLAGFLLWLLGWRVLPAPWQGRPGALLALGLGAMLGAALIEFLWYALATNLPAGRIALANLDLAFGPRPAVWVGIVAAALVALAGLRRIAAGRGPA